MNYLECGKVKIPLCYVESISYNRKARTTKKAGGYSRALGFENTEISVRATFSVAIAQANDRDLRDDYFLFDSLVTERLDQPAACTIGGYPIVPSLLFALTSINKTRIYDSAFDPTMEVDIVLAGVQPSKEASRSRIMMFDEAEAAAMVPAVTLSCEGKDLELSGAYALSAFTTTPDSCSIVIAIADDMAIAKQPAFLEALVRKEATFNVSYATGTTKYWVADASLDDNILTLTGSVVPPESQKTYIHSYWDTSLGKILSDLCKRMNVKSENKFTDFKVDYYQSRTTPMDAIREIVQSAGLIMSWRQNNLTFAQPPSMVAPTIELQAIDTPDDTGVEMVVGCDWRDGVNRHTTGDLNGETLHIQSVFRTESSYPCKWCFELNRQTQRVTVLNTIIYPNILHGSAVSVNSNGTMRDGYVSNCELDWLSGLGRYEVNIMA